jgi:hypothetical protein
MTTWMIEAACSHSDSIPCFDYPPCKFSKQRLTTHQYGGLATLEYPNMPNLRRMALSLTVQSHLIMFPSEGQEKYLRELSVTPVGHSRGVPVLHGSYKKSLPCGVPQELFYMAKMRYLTLRGTGMIFPKVSFTLDVI